MLIWDKVYASRRNGYALCDLNKVEDEFYFLMSCPRYAHEQCYVVDCCSSRL